MSLKSIIKKRGSQPPQRGLKQHLFNKRYKQPSAEGVVYSSEGDHWGRDNGRIPHPGRCYNFDGVDDYVVLNNTKQSLSFIPNSLVFTIAFWFKLDNYESDDNNAVSAFIGNSVNPITKGFVVQYLNRASQSESNIISFSAQNGDAFVYGFSIDNAVTDNDWHFLCVKGVGNGVDIFIDDQKFSDRKTNIVYSTGDMQYNVRLGASPSKVGSDDAAGNYAPAYLDGSLSNILVYDVSLTDEEISNLKNKNTLKYIPSIHYKCDDTGLITFDSSGNEFHGTKIGTDVLAANTFHYEGSDVPYSYQNEIGYSNYVKFRNAKDTHLNFGDDPASNFNSVTKGFTIAFNLKWDAGFSSQDKCIIMGRCAASPLTANYDDINWFIDNSDGRTRIIFRGGGLIYDTLLAQASNSAKAMVRFVLAYDKATNTLSGYYNNTTTISSATPSFDLTQHDILHPFTIGKRFNDHNIEGTVCNVEIYHTPWTAEDVEYDYNNFVSGEWDKKVYDRAESLVERSDLKLHFKGYGKDLEQLTKDEYIEHAQGLKATYGDKPEIELVPRDESDITRDVYTNKLLYSGEVAYDGQLTESNCLEFDGVDGYIEPANLFIGGGAFNFSTGFMISSFNQSTGVIFMGLDDQDSGKVLIYILETGQLRFIIRTDGGIGNGLDITTTDSVISINTPYHLSFDYNGGSDISSISIYVNNKKIEKLNKITTGTFTALATDITKNRIARTTTVYTSQSLWDIRGFKRSLTPEERRKVYEGYLVEGSLWTIPCSEGGGRTVFDKSPNANHGTLIGGVSWGKQDVFHHNYFNGYKTKNWFTIGNGIHFVNTPFTIRTDEICTLKIVFKPLRHTSNPGMFELYKNSGGINNGLRVYDYGFFANSGTAKYFVPEQSNSYKLSLHTLYTLEIESKADGLWYGKLNGVETDTPTSGVLMEIDSVVVKDGGDVFIQEIEISNTTTGYHEKLSFIDGEVRTLTKKVQVTSTIGEIPFGCRVPLSVNMLDILTHEYPKYIIEYRSSLRDHNGAETKFNSNPFNAPLLSDMSIDSLETIHEKASIRFRDKGGRKNNLLKYNDFEGQCLKLTPNGNISSFHYTTEAATVNINANITAFWVKPLSNGSGSKRQILFNDQSGALWRYFGYGDESKFGFRASIRFKETSSLNEWVFIVAVSNGNDTIMYQNHFNFSQVTYNTLNHRIVALGRGQNRVTDLAADYHLLNVVGYSGKLTEEAFYQIKSFQHPRDLSLRCNIITNKEDKSTLIDTVTGAVFTRHAALADEDVDQVQNLYPIQPHEQSKVQRILNYTKQL